MYIIKIIIIKYSLKDASCEIIHENSKNYFILVKPTIFNVGNFIS